MVGEGGPVGVSPNTPRARDKQKGGSAYLLAKPPIW